MKQWFSGCKRGVLFGGFWFFLCLLLGLSGWMEALDPRLAITQYVHTVWEMEDGLPTNTLLAITQTADGYLWIGTQDGLVRFDGLFFKTFSRSTVPGMTSNYITALHPGDGAYLWIGTRRGLIRLEGGQFKLITSRDGLPDDSVTCLYRSRDGSLWVGTENGLAQLVNGRIRGFPIPAGFKSFPVIALGEDSTGQLWVGSRTGLFTLANGHFQRLNWPGLPAECHISAIFRDHQGLMWVGTRAGLFKLDPNQARSFTAKNGLASEMIMCLRGDRHGNIWVGTEQGGLARMAGEELRVYTKQDGLSNDVVFDVLEDQEQNLWVVTACGLNRFYQGKVITWTSREGLVGNKAFPVFEDRRHRVWVGTVNGLSAFQEGKFSQWPLPGGQNGGAVRSLCQGREERIWVGLEKGGLVRLHNGSMTSYSTRQGLTDTAVMALLVDQGGDLWVGTKRGLDRFRGEVITPAAKWEALKDHDIRFIHQSRDGSIWAGTNGSGLARIQSGVVTWYRVSPESSCNKVWTIWEDQDGIFWIGSYGGGLVRMKGGKFTFYNPDCPSPEKVGSRQPEGILLDSVVYQVIGDSIGNLWVSSNKGIYRVSRQELNDYADGKIHQVGLLCLGKEEGMKNRECDGASQPAGCRTSDGHLWFPTLEGVVEIDPADLHLNTHPPPVVLDAVFIDGKELTGGPGWVELPAGTKDISFHYRGLSYVNPKKVRYRYRLLGYKPAWVEAGPNRIASYTNLGPGEYSFQVCACNNDDVWNPAGTAFVFSIRTPFWNTWWFRSAVVILGAVLLNLLYAAGRKLAVSFKFWRRAHTAGPYRLLDTIGKGGMGTVYRARDTRDGRVVALKIFHEDITDDEIRQRFSQECAICENIQHPNMVKIFQHGEAEGRLYYAMELCEGRTLRELIRTGPIALDLATRIITNLFDIVHDIHQLGVIHRDIKPENILFRAGYDLSVSSALPDIKSGMVLLDFGLARVIDARSRTRTGLVTGTVDYLSPEYLRRSRPADTILDFYSIGIIFYELLTGRTPYWEGGDDMMQRIYAIVYSDPIPPHTLKADIPESLSALAMELIAKDHHRRLVDYQTIKSRFKQVCPDSR